MIASKLLNDQIKDSTLADMMLLFVGAVLVLIYSIIFSGTCHPIGMRSTVALIAFAVALFSVLTAYGVSSIVGLRFASYAFILGPFMLLITLY